MKMLKLYVLKKSRSTFENNQNFPFPLFLDEFVQWVPHSFLENTYWVSETGDFVLQPFSHTNLLQPVMNLLLFFYLILHSVKHRHYVFLASKINTYISEWQIQCSSHVEVFVAYYGSDCLTCPYGFFKQIMLGNGTVLCPFWTAL